MRTMTAAQEAVLEAGAGYASHVRVKVQHDNSTWYDLTSLYDRDFLEAVEWDESVDQPVGQATVRCRREVDDFSLAPLVTTSKLNLLSGSYDPLLEEGNLFVVEVAVVPLEVDTPASGDWMEAFRGRIDSVDAGDDVLTFKGRDLGGRLMSTMIETEATYGSTSPGTALETVVQSILTDNGTGVTLYTPTSPLWNLGPYKQATQQVLQACIELARQVAWDVRYKWDSGTSAFRLTLYSPNRSANSPVWTFTADNYRQLATCYSSVEDVRNKVRVVYSDTADLDASGEPKRKTYTAQDAGSQAEYGVLFMQIAEDASSNINTATEAQRMADGALSDLKTTNLEVAGEVDFFPHVELGDLVRWQGNSYHFTADQDLAVVSFRHVLTRERAATSLTTRGKPSISLRKWLEVEARTYSEPPPPFTGPNAPTSLTATSTVNGFALTFSPPTTGPEATSYELHVSTSSGFTPDTANPSTTLKATTDTQRFEVADLTPGTTYYAKMVPRDAKGNRGTASAQATLTARYVEPRILQPRITYAAVPLNAEFEAWNDLTTAPDTWTLDSGSWGTDATYSTDTYSGGLAVSLTSASAELKSGPFTVRALGRFGADCYAKCTGATAGTIVNLRIRWLDAAFASISVTVVDAYTFTGVSGWVRLKGVVQAPSTARYGVVSLIKTSGPAILFDSAGVYEPNDLQADWRSPGYAPPGLNEYQNGWIPYTTGSRSAPRYMVANDGFVHMSGMIQSGTIGAVALVLPTDCRPDYVQDYAVPCFTGFGHIEVWPNGDVKIITGSATWTSLCVPPWRAA